MIRLLDLTLLPRRVEHVRCSVSSCGETTREGKPYCIKHLYKMPAVRQLLVQIGKNMEDDLRANDIHSVSAQSMLQIVRECPTTARRLKLVLHLTEESVTGYIKALEEAGLVKVRTNKRGVKIVEGV